MKAFRMGLLAAICVGALVRAQGTPTSTNCLSPGVPEELASARNLTYQ